MFEAEDAKLKSLPLAVQQKQIIVTCNYEGEALNIPNLVFFPCFLSMQTLTPNPKPDEEGYISSNAFLKLDGFVQRVNSMYLQQCLIYQ